MIIVTYSNALMGDVQVMSEKGTVAFGSSLHGCYPDFNFMNYVSEAAQRRSSSAQRIDSMRRRFDTMLRPDNSAWTS